MSFSLYRAFGADDTLLYIGCSRSVDKRLREHRRSSAWFVDASRIDIDPLPAGTTRAEAEELELHAIAAERPPHNQAHNPDRVGEVKKRRAERRARADQIEAELALLWDRLIDRLIEPDEYVRHKHRLIAGEYHGDPSVVTADHPQTATAPKN